MEEKVLDESKVENVQVNKYVNIVLISCIAIIVILCIAIALVWINIKINSKYVSYDRIYSANTVFFNVNDKSYALEIGIKYLDDYFENYLNAVDDFNNSLNIKNITDACRFEKIDFDIEKEIINNRVENYTLTLNRKSMLRKDVKKVSLNHNKVKLRKVSLNEIILDDKIEQFKEYCNNSSKIKNLDFSNFTMKKNSLLIYSENSNDSYEVPYDDVASYLKNGLFTKENISDYDKIFNSQINPYEPMIALTFDDGPYGPSTSRILKVLSENDARATFFEVGYMIDQYPDTVKEIVDQGSEIGNHTKDHYNLTKYNSQTISYEIAYVQNRVYDITGKYPKYTRTPGGNHNDSVCMIIDMPIITWNVDTLDWKTKDPEMTKNHILEHVADGDIILMHDLYITTAEAAEMVIPILKDMGYQMVTVSELLYYKEITPENGQVIRCAK